MSQNQSASDNKRLAKNTVLLYVRTFVVLIIGLLSSRLILKTLGVDDYGVYNIVGGFVALFSVISSTLVATTQRFLNFELGKQENSRPQVYFNASLVIHLVLAVVLFFLFETVGLYFLNTHLNIPEERMVAANWVFQCSILAFIFNIISTPFTAVLIAHERMSAYAYITLFESVMRLIVVYNLFLSPFDFLITYSVLLLVVSIIVGGTYIIYCKRLFVETSFILVKDENLYRGIFKFASTNFVGSLATIMANQGLDVILNLFFGIRINAARGIANQVQGAASKFVNDFMTALNPQITKEYAANNHEKSKELCFRGSKFAFFMMLILSLPVMIRAPYILELWLDVFPEYAVSFVRLGLLYSLLCLLSNALVTEMLATGNLTTTTLWIGGTRLLTLPIAYLVFYCTGCEPMYSYVILISIEIISLAIRLIILETITNMKFFIPFVKEVITRVLFVSIISVSLILQVNNMIEQNFIGLLMFVLISVLIIVITISFIGMSSVEKDAILKMITQKIGKSS